MGITDCKFLSLQIAEAVLLVQLEVDEEGGGGEDNDDIKLGVGDVKLIDTYEDDGVVSIEVIMSWFPLFPWIIEYIFGEIEFNCG